MERRHFLGCAGLAAAGGRIRVAVMGVRGRGSRLAGEFSRQREVEVVYLCDPDSGVFERALKAVEETGKPRPATIGDFRRALDDQSIDALVIGAPDHWHAPATILACQAGKDVYVEKPASHNLREGRLMVEAARRYGRIVQHGTQARSDAGVRQAIEYIQAGKLGKVLMAKAWNVQMRQNIGRQEDSPVPAGVDFDMWTGPAPMLPFNRNRYHYRWHWHWNYGTGDAGNDGVHQLDLARWALGVEAPVRVSGMARKVFFEDDQQTPDTMNITYDYGPMLMAFEMRIWNPYGLEGDTNSLAVYGSEGMLRFNGLKVFDRQGKEVPVEFSRGVANASEAHVRDFLEAMKTRRPPCADIAIGHASSLHSHLGNIVARTGRNLSFDPQTETIPADAEANALLRRDYRQHWAVPKGV